MVTAKSIKRKEIHNKDRNMFVSTTQFKFISCGVLVLSKRVFFLFLWGIRLMEYIQRNENSENYLPPQVPRVVCND